MKSDIAIAQANKMLPITEVAKQVGIKDIEQYGKYKAKINVENKTRKDSKLILVTALTPTAAGEGKTTVSIGIADALHKYLPDKKTMLALREPSLGPVFGIKGGAAGGGYSQVVPMEDINLHFTGDFHAIGAANNLLAAMIDNHIQQGNKLGIDPKKITWKRAVDMNDRQLRHIVSGLGGALQGVPREDGFDITVASEVMAVFCLATSLSDLKRRLANITIGYSYDNKPIKAKDLKAEGAMTVLLKDAFKPNLVQTLEHTPAIVHGGPFANIAHGCNSIVATKTAMHHADYVVTEAGFGADLGAEKFLDIKCRSGNIKPNAVVIVATVRALKMHGGMGAGLLLPKLKKELQKEDLVALKKGMPNLLQHAENIRSVYHLPCLIVINKFLTDTDTEINTVKKICVENNFDVVTSTACINGSKDNEALANAVVKVCDKDNSKFTYAYDADKPIEDKIRELAQNIYHAKDITLTPQAKKDLMLIKKNKKDNLPICVAKTQYSFSDNPTLINAPKDFVLTVRSLKLNSGAGFIVVLTGDIMTMPGLPVKPAAESIDLVDNKVVGLF